MSRVFQVEDDSEPAWVNHLVVSLYLTTQFRTPADGVKGLPRPRKEAQDGPPGLNYDTSPDTH